MEWGTWFLVGMLLLSTAILVVQRDRLARQLAHTRGALYVAELRAATVTPPKRKLEPKDWPPGTIPVELALAVQEEWRRAGYHLVDDARVVLRLLSIAHRVMCLHKPSSLAPALYNDGDRIVPAKVACQAVTACSFPDCACEAIEPPPPPLPPARPKPNRPGKKG